MWMSFEYNNGQTHTRTYYNIRTIVILWLWTWNFIIYTKRIMLAYPYFRSLVPYTHTYTPIVEEMYFMFIASTGKVLFPLWKHRRSGSRYRLTHIYHTHVIGTFCVYDSFCPHFPQISILFMVVDVKRTKLCVFIKRQRT